MTSQTAPDQSAASDEPNKGASLKDTLDQASSIELFHLSMVIERLMADPKRVIEVRRQLHIGQSVQFLDAMNPSLELKTIAGTVVALADTQVTLLEAGTKRQWKLPYAAVALPQTGSGGAGAQQAQATPPPIQPRRLTRDDFRVGDRVSFDDKYLRTHIGTVIRINQKTATLDCGDLQWRVSFQLLRHVHDI